VHLRNATLSDVGFLTDVVVEATRDQGRLAADFDEASFRHGFRARTGREVRGEIADSSTYVIEVGGEAVGRLRVIRTESSVELAGLQLLPRCQSRGIGSQIVRQLMDEAAATGLPFDLEVEKDNPRARALYERLGMHLAGENDTDHHLRAT
jgi:ribosomal protein S18 acetylase RimI-like enzyme